MPYKKEKIEIYFYIYRRKDIIEEKVYIWGFPFMGTPFRGVREDSRTSRQQAKVVLAFYSLPVLSLWSSIIPCIGHTFPIQQMLLYL